ncbi:MAG: hypothetical protein JO187_07260 [Acidobacteria bacterium]|nr:hypothetical protein [Acidobacteriota bacterium]
MTSPDSRDRFTPTLSAGLDRSERPGGVVAWTTAIVLSAGVVFLDRLIRDISISLFLVTIVALMLGSIWRARAWRWAIVAGATLPAAALGSALIHHDPLEPALVYVMGFVPSFVGAYMGAFLNKMVSALRGKED